MQSGINFNFQFFIVFAKYHTIFLSTIFPLHSPQYLTLSIHNKKHIRKWHLVRPVCVFEKNKNYQFKKKIRFATFQHNFNFGPMFGQCFTIWTIFLKMCHQKMLNLPGDSLPIGCSLQNLAKKKPWFTCMLYIYIIASWQNCV